MIPRADMKVRPSLRGSSASQRASDALAGVSEVVSDEIREGHRSHVEPIAP